jgi:hypothetical protein
MNLTWQDLATICIVLLSAGYVVRYIVRWAKRKGQPGCGCCTKCPAEPSEEPLVTLDKRTEK